MTPAQGAAPGRSCGGGGEEEPREEQSRGWPQCFWVCGAAAAGAGLRGLRVSEGGHGHDRLCPSGFFPTSYTFLFSMKFQWEKMDFVSLLLLFFSAVAVS